ncbi:LOW QUALITY PROTEIN: DNA repair endonuclease XPF [Nylanderia fulva]|uniref:LOW QUALITY PROTEIN: DNA repair endonuclease XPF n=1 Tax=Nylanderia fulva TaxID=613905 RepID=UPI0010FB263C|nr:LOW QUALITY PROTEIN: DNA repair endonuclease XPF [Nylanderia fulva]
MRCTMKTTFVIATLITCVLALEEELLHYVSDDVPGGSYKYYSLTYDGYIKIRLSSLTGDADLYASQTTTKPTYEPDHYCLQSTTCGEDIIFIPKSFKRPVSIGVYGHPSHEVSKYTLLVSELMIEDDTIPYDQISRSRSINMLEYENQMFLEIIQEDGLVITAKGLGIETVFANVIKAYSDPGNLVIILGTTDHDEHYFIELLKSYGTNTLPHIVNSEYTSSEREIMYLEGGVLFISGRILVVDLLKNRVPLHLVTGILVYRAHNILNKYQEAFALRLYRQNNKTGFIKAFTNSSLAFTVGYSQVERVMKALFVKKLYLWPRFHAIVSNSLSKHEPDVIELHVQITPKMQNIQAALLDVMNYIVKELKRINKYLDLDELTVENAIAKKFHKQLHLQLDPIWHQLSTTTKQLLSDLKILRSLIISLIHEDSVSFYAMLNRLRTMEYAVKASGWIMLDEVENLFKYAKSRVYTDKNELKPEPNPKWIALSQVLSEIQEQNLKKRSENVDKVLILAHDNNICRQLKNFLTMGANKYLFYEALKKLSHNKEQKESGNNGKNVKDQQSTSESNTDEDAQNDQDTFILTLTQKCADETQPSTSTENTNQTLFEECSQLADLDLTNCATSAPIVFIQAIKKGGDSMALQRALAEHMPNNIILYVADIGTVRQLEVYQNNNPSIDLKIYFLIYDGSVEEQEYLTSLRREKEAFHSLINTKKIMVVPEDQDGKSEDCLALTIQSDNTNQENTRKGGMQSEVKIIPKVIVDMREFRSELPAILYTRGIKVEPVTLVVGDYILTPEICVERKSISDLIGSLFSGRLYNQAVAMTRHYAKPMLLIEFDQNKAFCFQGNYYVSRDLKNTEITAKLQLLTLHFPKLKIIWSPSPQATAQLFEELKQGRAQPDSNVAAKIGADEDTENKQLMVERYNSNIQDFMTKLPGVHSKNLRILLNKGQSLSHLIKLTQEELKEILGNTNDAELLYKAMHGKCLPTDEKSSTSKGASKVRGKKFFSRIKK